MPTAPRFPPASPASTRPSSRSEARRLDVTGQAELTLESTPRFVRLAISGELDISTAAQLRALLASLEGVERCLRVDLSEVSFTDCTGLAPILDAAQSRAQTGLPPLVLTDISRAVRRLLDILVDDPGTRALGRPSPVTVGDAEAKECKE